MSLEHSPARAAVGGEAQDEEPNPNPAGDDYWDAYIDERVAAEFLNLTPRTLQTWRQTGKGPKFFRFSARCIKYTRRRLKAHADARLRSSTADDGREADR